MKTAIRTKASNFYFWMAAFCALMAITFICLSVFSAYAMNAEETGKFKVWLNGNGEMNQMTKSLAMGFFRIDTKFYDNLTKDQIQELKKKKDEFMWDAIRITKDKYGGYRNKKQVEKEKRGINYKGIGLHLIIPKGLHEERKKYFKKQIMSAVPGLGLTDEDFDRKEASADTVKFINAVADKLAEKNLEFGKFLKIYEENVLDETGVEITEVIVGGPAFKAGLKSKERIEDVKDGWRITRINGKGSDGFSIEDFINFILKDKKRSVVLTLTSPLSENEKETIEVKIKKGIVKSTWLTNKIVDTDFGKIGIITFNQFDFTRQEGKLNIKMFEDALIANKDCAGLIVILNDNPGGLLVEADIVLDRLLPNGRTEIIVDERGERRKPISTSAKIKRMWTGGPIVFMLNGESASASELVAGSMREQLPNLVKIVGTPPFGKGSIQYHYTDFPDGTKMKITIGRFKMPVSEECFEGKPLQPDVLVEDDKSTPEDEQLEKAIEVLGKLVLFNDKKKALIKSMVFE